jgi:murein DD-endopeptidase MepM/ murein hydrolase activator NlpD
MTLDIRPSRLFVSILPSGEREFACDVHLAGSDPPPASLRRHMHDQARAAIVSGLAMPGEREQASGLGRVVALLRAAFGEGIAADTFIGFGQPVLAPGDGRVVSAPDGQQIGVYPDVQPFLDDLRRAQGNCVIIEHDAGVFSCLAHLRQGSVRVAAGDAVRAGQPVMGNSGFSSGPHLHLHFVDGPDPLGAHALPVQLHMEGQQYAPLTGEILASA